MAIPELQPLQQLTPEVCLIVEPATTPQSGFANLLGNAKKVSDLGFAIPALLYTCGFVVLGCYAEESNIGLQAFPTIQFFSAGAGFLLIFVCIVLLIMAIRRLLRKCFAWLNSGGTVSKLVKKVIPWVLGLSFGLFYVAGAFHLERTKVVALCTITASLFFSAEDWVQRLAQYWLYFVVFVVGVMSLALYAFSLYPVLPASFGGGKPRHAHVQVDARAIPPQVLQQLGPNIANGGLEADVYLVTDSAVVIKSLLPARPEPAAATPSNAKRQPSMILQLRRSDVSAIFWDANR